MVHLIAFQTEKELEELTGLTHDELWDAGFDLDDWDAGFQSDTKLHAEVNEENIRFGNHLQNMVMRDDCPCRWLMWQMDNYCVGAGYTKYKGKHYYMVYHS